MDKEIWKDTTCDNKYMISNKGNVFSKKNNIIMKQNTLKKGYKRVQLSNGKRYLVHRLVAEAFIPNPYNFPQVNHIDGNKQNNCVDNLEWCTQSYNMRHALNNGLKVAPKGKDVYNARAVIQLDKNNNFIKEWETISEVKKELKLTHVSDVCYKKRKHCGGYNWKFKEEYYG